MSTVSPPQDDSRTLRPEAGSSAGAGSAKETLEDYTLRFAPRSYRRWGTGMVAISALGGIAYLADFAIGANVVASDIVINKYLLKISPKEPEFRRGMLYAVNPVGFGSMLLAAGISIIDFYGGLGSGLKPYSPLVAIVLALVLPPILAIATRGRYYLRRTDDGIDLPMYDEHGNPSGETLTCHVCHQDYECPDMVRCQTHDAYICSLDLSTDRLGDHVLPAQP